MKKIVSLLITALAVSIAGRPGTRAAVTVQTAENVVGTGTNAWSYLIVEGESYESETDETDGVGFMRVDNTGSLTSPSGSTILATNTTASQKGALFTATPFGRHIDKVTYRVQFATPGTYYLYMRFTMFENAENGTYLNEDSFFLPPDLNKDPQNDWPLVDPTGQTGGYVEGCCDAAGFLFFNENGSVVNHSAGDEEGRKFWEGNFHWHSLTSSQFLNAETTGEPLVRFKYEVTADMVGKPQDFTVSYREGGVTIDLFLFSTNPDLLEQYSEARLDQTLLGIKLSIQDPANVVGTGTNAWSYLIVEGEDYASEMDATDGVGFMRVDSSGSLSNLIGSAILAPDTTASKKGALFTATPFARHIDKVTYRVQFATPGTYYVYMRFTMFENSENGTYLNEDSFFMPPDFNKDPQTDWPLVDPTGQTGGYVEGCCDAAGFLYIPEAGTVVNHSAGDEEGRAYWEGNFHWNALTSSQFLNAETTGEPLVRFKYEVTPDLVGKPLDFTISYREGGLTIDFFLFSTNPDLMQNYTQAELDKLLLAPSAGGSGPQIAISRTGNNVVLSWPVSAAGFVLESAPGLNSPTWTAVAGAPTVNGDQNTVTAESSTGTRFYRLRKP